MNQLSNKKRMFLLSIESSLISQQEQALKDKQFDKVLKIERVLQALEPGLLIAREEDQQEKYCWDALYKAGFLSRKAA